MVNRIKQDQQTNYFPLRGEIMFIAPWFLFVPSSNIWQATWPLVLVKVCHTWRTLALSTPGLWSVIYVNAENPNLPFLDHQIAHSAISPLSIHLFAKSRSTQDLGRTRQSISIVTHSDFFRVFKSVSESNLPQTAPLLKELHFHCPSQLGGTFPLRLAIEPPYPQRVHLQSISCNVVRLDWTNISSLTLILT